MSAKYTFLAWDTPIENAPLKLALLQLANNSDDSGFSYYSISRMAKACGMSERTFMRKIAELEKLGVLTVERRPNRPSLYKLIGDEMGVTLCHLQNFEVTESHLGVTESHLEGDRESPDPNSDPNSDPDTKELCAKEDDFAFAYFWSNWHNKKGKVKAEQAFERVFKKRCKELKIEASIQNKLKFADKLSADTQLRVASQQMGFDKIHPTTYLNGERWNDDYDKEAEAVKQNSGQSQQQARKPRLSPSEAFRQKQIANGKRPTF